jgi:hypothetical protein
MYGSTYRRKENANLELTSTPGYFATLPPLSLHQIVFFNECHKKTELGRTGETVCSFPRNENEMYDKADGTPDVETKIHLKDAKEGRFSFSVASVELSNGMLEGCRCETFDYSAKNLITNTAEEKMISKALLLFKYC